MDLLDFFIVAVLVVLSLDLVWRFMLSREEEKELCDGIRDLNRNLRGFVKEFRLLRETLDRFVQDEPPVYPAEIIEDQQFIDGQEVGEGMKEMELGQRASVKNIKFKDRFQKEAKVDGNPVISLVDAGAPGLLSVDEGARGFKFQFSTEASEGSLVQVKLVADVDLGEGFKPLEKLYEYTLKGSEAVAIEDEESVEDIPAEPIPEPVPDPEIVP